MFQLTTGEEIPLEFHRTCIVRQVRMAPPRERLEALRSAGFNSFLLQSRDVFLDMLTDSGTNAMSDRQLAAMQQADDAYAGSESFCRFREKIADIFHKPFVLPAHQGRGAENVLCRTLVREGSIVPMNYHFSSIRDLIRAYGGEVVELPMDEAFDLDSCYPFKGNCHVGRLEDLLRREGPERVPFIRMEACANLIGGQPFSLENLRAVRAVCEKFGVLLVLDASLLAENLHFIGRRERPTTPLREIAAEMAALCDIIYFSARKFGCAKGGAIATASEPLYRAMAPFVILFEGFLTSGGMSMREMEAATVGLEEAMDPEQVRLAPEFVDYMCRELKKLDVPTLSPPGALGCHVDGRRFLEHVSTQEYPAAALAAALFLASGIRAMERGALSDGSVGGRDRPLPVPELLRLAVPRKVFTLSQLRYAVDRIGWLFRNRQLIGGMELADGETPAESFAARLRPVGGWENVLLQKLLKEGLA
ncbi:MAG: tryptophanase [Puniceicoccales bacterium]|jgi:tryptophanase|nr:tryptophanase [Puniceicoccales bacterium]